MATGITIAIGITMLKLSCLFESEAVYKNREKEKEALLNHGSYACVYSLYDNISYLPHEKDTAMLVHHSNLFSWR